MNRLFSVSMLGRRVICGVVTLSALLLSLTSHELHADVGGNNPTGVAGMFNGNIYTGRDSYDPLTGNMMHAATDITVAGAVGAYGLSFSRFSNSRGGVGWSFGLPGWWRHSYEWLMSDSPRVLGSHPPPTSYQVEFPDGRVETFTSSPNDPIYYCSTAGTREHLQPMDNNGIVRLILADGGKVEFLGTLNSEWDPDYHQHEYWYSYQAQAIIDPYGLRTTFTYNNDGTLYRVTEPAGRYIQFTWGSRYGSTVIISVQGSDGRSVQYNYSSISPSGSAYTALTSVVYYGNANWTTLYKYTAPNVGVQNGVPLLWTANDPMYFGPMKRIAYEYKTGTNADGSSALYGQIYRERYWDGVAGHEANGAAVSTLTVGTTNNPYIRTETRADGKTRTFTYSTDGYKLSWTDFMNHTASRTLDANKYVNGVTDFKGNTTNFTNNALNGNTWFVTYPLTQGDTPGQTQRPMVQQSYSW